MTGELESKIISFLRFPLIAGVVLIHAYGGLTMQGKDMGTLNEYPINDAIQYLFSRIFTSVCVPCFFFISGYLFYIKESDCYKNKIRKRIKTLLIPYLFWNALILLFLYTAQTLPSISNLFSGAHKLIRDYSFRDFLYAFWSVEGGDPIVGQFWFLRDLMAVCIFSPVIKIFISKFKHWGILLLGVLWFFDWWTNMLWFGSKAGFFFSLGAYFSLNKKSFLDSIYKYIRYEYIIYLVLIIADLISRDTKYNIYIHNSGVIIGLIVLIKSTAYLIKKQVHIMPVLTNASFLIYAMHEPFQRLFRKVLFKTLIPDREIVFIALYFTVPAIIITLITLFYLLLHKYYPSFLKYITGGR